MAALTEQGKLVTRFGDYAWYPLASIQGIEALPMSLKILLENVIRNAVDEEGAQVAAKRVLEAGLSASTGEEVEFAPARVLFQDFTGVPVFVDFAVMREACQELGGDPARVNPQVPCDLVIDHSVIADVAGCAEALAENEALEFERNAERYSFLKWAQESFENVRVVAPGAGICHQLNIEQFAHVVMVREQGEGQPPLAYFDTLVGTDSHTPTANGLGILGWGVGGIEAEAAALGQAITTLVPRVVGVRLTGRLSPEATGMDVALTFAERLRKEGVVGAFVECFGPGLATMSATQRACVSNMTPEYGCTCTLFPVDRRTMDYLELTGRSAEERALVEAYARAQGLWGDPGSKCTYSKVIEIDLSAIGRSMAGPSRPHDRFDLAKAKARFESIAEERNLDLGKHVEVELPDGPAELGHGAIAIAAVTSCTTATDPAMMLSCGLFAKHAAEAGLKSAPWVKTILAPGSHATQTMLERAGLADSLRKLGFFTCGFGCMSCIGNSGPLSGEMHAIADEIELASVLSGNRNFEGRISPDVSQNYLMAPALVVAYAIAGRMDVDLLNEPLGVDSDGKAVYLEELWPGSEEVNALVEEFVTPDLFEEGVRAVREGNAAWKILDTPSGDIFSWDPASTYVRRAPYFDGMTAELPEQRRIENARVLALLGDFITTDHISPAGAIAPDGAAAAYLEEHGVAPKDFNTYGSRRGNHEVMMRGTFANVKLQNALAEGKRGGYTRNFETGAISLLFDAAQAYQEVGSNIIVIAGQMYGSGSSRDWAAKGPLLQGVGAVIAQSYERIHRSNLVGMGILPLQFLEGEGAETLGLTGEERYSVAPIDFSEGLPNPRIVEVTARAEDGTEKRFSATARIDTPTEGHYYRNGGILPYTLRQFI